MITSLLFSSSHSFRGPLNLVSGDDVHCDLPFFPIGIVTHCSDTASESSLVSSISHIHTTPCSPGGHLYIVPEVVLSICRLWSFPTSPALTFRLLLILQMMYRNCNFRRFISSTAVFSFPRRLHVLSDWLIDWLIDWFIVWIIIIIIIIHL